MQLKWRRNEVTKMKWNRHTVQKFMVEKFVVEKSGVERSGVEAWGWKVQGWDVLQPLIAAFKIISASSMSIFIPSSFPSWFFISQAMLLTRSTAPWTSLKKKFDASFTDTKYFWRKVSRYRYLKIPFRKKYLD